MWSNGYTPLVRIGLADNSNREVFVWSRNNRRDIIGRNCRVGVMSSGSVGLVSSWEDR